MIGHKPFHPFSLQILWRHIVYYIVFRLRIFNLNVNPILSSRMHTIYRYLERTLYTVISHEVERT